MSRQSAFLTANRGKGRARRGTSRGRTGGDNRTSHSRHLGSEMGRDERGGTFIPPTLSREELADMTGTTGAE